jgi:predicted nucleic acid-binding Zn ribbon protein
MGILQDNEGEDIILDLDEGVNPFDIPVSRYMCLGCQRVMHYYVGDDPLTMKCPRCQSVAKLEQATVSLIIQGGSVFYREYA